MRLGFCIPHMGEAAGPAAIRAVAERAEALGYDSLWVADRLLHPVAPKTKYPPAPDGALPATYKRVMDPIVSLAFAAACTKRVRLGTSVLVLPLYNPVLLARELTTLDVLSEGRLTLGFGTGWSLDEYEAAGVDPRTRGARANEALDLFTRYWADDEPEHHGKLFSLPKSNLLRPVQRPRPRLYMAAYAPVTMKRVAERTDGWNPAGLPVIVMTEMWSVIKGMAAAAGRDPEVLEMVVRANLDITSEPRGEGRPIFSGTMAQVREDVLATRDAGAHELLFDVHFTRSVTTQEHHLALLEELREIGR